MKNILLMLSITAVLAACNPEREQAKTFMKCGIAASQLEQHRAIKMIREKSTQINLNLSARDSMILGQEIREDLGFDDPERSDLAKFYSLIKIYNSSECVELHEQSTIDGGFLYYLLYIFV